MDNLTSLFKLLELTRSQPQYGYVLAGIPKAQLSDLAQHHYLVTIIAWQLARNANRAGANLNVQKVLEFCLVHDLGELFGGDISMPYARVNKRAKRLAKDFETENQKFFAKFFGDDSRYFKELTKEIMNAKSDEALVAKIADYLECAHYKLYVNHTDKKDLQVNTEKIESYINKMKDRNARQYFFSFLRQWNLEFFENNSNSHILYNGH